MNLTRLEPGPRLTEHGEGPALEITNPSTSDAAERGLCGFVIRLIIRYIERIAPSNRPDGYQPDNDEDPGCPVRFLRSRHSVRR